MLEALGNDSACFAGKRAARSLRAAVASSAAPVVELDGLSSIECRTILADVSKQAFGGGGSAFGGGDITMDKVGSLTPTILLGAGYESEW